MSDILSSATYETVSGSVVLRGTKETENAVFITLKERAARTHRREEFSHARYWCRTTLTLLNSFALLPINRPCFRGSISLLLFIIRSFAYGFVLWSCASSVWDR